MSGWYPQLRTDRTRGESSSLTRNRLTPTSHSVISHLAHPDNHISFSVAEGKYHLIKVAQERQFIDARTIRLLVRAGWVRSCYRDPHRYQLTHAGQAMLRRDIRFSAYRSAQERAARKRFPKVHTLRPVQIPLFSYQLAA